MVNKDTLTTEQYRRTCVEFWRKSKGKKYINTITGDIVAIGDTVTNMGGTTFLLGGELYAYISIGIEDIVFNLRRYFLPIKDDMWLALEKDLQIYFEQAHKEK